MLNDLMNLFFPVLCLSCRRQTTNKAEGICLRCRHELPLAKYTSFDNNPLEKKFFGRIRIEQATALFLFYKNNPIQKLIHELKYRRHEELGALFGEWLGAEMKSSHRFSALNCIVPVPLHPTRQKTRGYNQLTCFGEKLAEQLQIHYIPDLLIKQYNSETQTQKNRIKRISSLQSSFLLKDLKFFEGKHVLLIDDVTTTGATLEICAKELLKTKHLKLSIAIMACTE